MKAKRTIAASLSAISVTILLLMVIPLVKLPFGQQLSYLDLAFGALSGGHWSQQRILLLVLFLGSSVMLLLSTKWLFQNMKKGRPSAQAKRLKE